MLFTLKGCVALASWVGVKGYVSGLFTQFQWDASNMTINEITTTVNMSTTFNVLNGVCISTYLAFYLFIYFVYSKFETDGMSPAHWFKELFWE